MEEIALKHVLLVLCGPNNNPPQSNIEDNERKGKRGNKEYSLGVYAVSAANIFFLKLFIYFLFERARKKTHERGGEKRKKVK